MQPVLTPGTHLLRRDRRTHQLGLAPGSRHQLSAQLDPVCPSTRDLPETLVLPDDRPLRAALPPADPSRWQHHTVAALARRVGTALPETLQRREAHRFAVQSFGVHPSEDLAALLTATLTRSGLRLRTRRYGPRPRGASAPRTIAVLLGVGEPTRADLDRHVREQRPHLVVRFAEGRAVVGPFVVPGSTACLRCLDAHHTDDDPAWPLLVEQYTRATRKERADGIPEPVDGALATVALGWAARDLASYAEGCTPTTWSATLTLSPTLDTVETRTWPPHPRCGCSWS